MQKLYFVRHGLSEMNKLGKWAGRTETPLSAEGRVQARQAGDLAKNLQIDYIISSPQSRAHDTAIIIAKTIGYPVDKIELNSLLIERDFGSLEGTTWLPDLDLDGFADVESVDTILERTKLALEYLETLPAKNILVVSHGSTGRALRHHIDPKYPFHNPVRFNNAEIVPLIQ